MDGVKRCGCFYPYIAFAYNKVMDGVKRCGCFYPYIAFAYNKVMDGVDRCGCFYPYIAFAYNKVMDGVDRCGCFYPYIAFAYNKIMDGVDRCGCFYHIASTYNKVMDGLTGVAFGWKARSGFSLWWSMHSQCLDPPEIGHINLTQLYRLKLAVTRSLTQCSSSAYGTASEELIHLMVLVTYLDLSLSCPNVARTQCVHAKRNLCVKSKVYFYVDKHWLFLQLLH